MKWMLLVLVVPALFVLALWFVQDHLIFFRQPLLSTTHIPANAVALDIAGGDGARLRGWLRTAEMSPAPLVLYFGGNGEEVSWTLADPRWPATWSVAAVNYRGYGESEGKPGEAALLADALVIYDALVARSDVRRDAVIVMGRSLGTGVAVHVTIARRVIGTILASPYDSVVAIGRSHYPWLPVSWLLKHRFEVLSLAQRADVPLLALVAEYDTIVPQARSRELYDAWRGPKVWRSIAGTDHNTLSMPDAFWQQIRDFSERRSPP